LRYREEGEVVGARLQKLRGGGAGKGKNRNKDGRPSQGGGRREASGILRRSEWRRLRDHIESKIIGNQSGWMDRKWRFLSNSQLVEEYCDVLWTNH
jgi:hypothetical protein